MCSGYIVRDGTWGSGRALPLFLATFQLQIDSDFKRLVFALSSEPPLLFKIRTPGSRHDIFRYFGFLFLLLPSVTRAKDIPGRALFHMCFLYELSPAYIANLNVCRRVPFK